TRLIAGRRWAVPYQGAAKMFRRDGPRDAAPETAPPLRRALPAQKTCAPPRRLGRPGSGLELLEYGLDRDDVPLELQLRLFEPGGHADQLREVEDRHREVATGRLVQ